MASGRVPKMNSIRFTRRFSVTRGLTINSHHCGVVALALQLSRKQPSREKLA
jgi:hypothetical protein